MGIGYIMNILKLKMNKINIIKLYKNIKLYFTYI
jgi:hypothetical protein